MQTGKGYLTGIMVRAIVERHGQGNALLLVVKQCHGIHATAQDNHCIFLHFGCKGSDNLARIARINTKKDNKSKKNKPFVPFVP